MDKLQQLILERIAREGPISFAEYMRMALYEPGYGYYVSGSAKMGWEGDYYTSSDVSTFFAHCMGRQLRLLWDQLKRPTPCVVLEQGAGRSTLARAIRVWAEQEDSEFYAALDYHDEDIHAGQDALQSTLSPVIILSNELVDAFPVHIIEKQGAKLYEMYVDTQHERLYEVLGEPVSTEVANYLDHYKIAWQTFADGWRAEVNLDALRWMERAAHLLTNPVDRRKRRGFILTIDYGDKANVLYMPDRQRGTLACYYHHQLTEQPLLRPGAQDITTHVNFTALLQEGRRNGLRLHAFTTQRQWLTEMGIYEELERLRTREFAVIDSALASDQGQTALFQWYNLRQSVATLTASAGMGNFKVLILKR